MPSEQVDGEEEEEKTKAQSAIYHNMRPPFIVTFMAGNSPRYLQADLTVVSRDQKAITNVISHAPLIRSQIVSLLTDQEYVTLQTDQGKLDLQDALRDLVNKILSEESGDSRIESILLTNFVMQ